MSDGWQSTPIDGVMVRKLVTHDDARGSFTELWRNSWTDELGVGQFVQANVSRSRTGVLRGLHFHLRQVDLWVIIEGHAHVSLVDIRGQLAAAGVPLEGEAGGGSSSATRASVQLSAGDALLIPVGVAHGLWALDSVTLLYLVTNQYDGTDELGFAWDDLDAAAEWPSGDPLVSPRDRDAASLREVVAVAAQSAQISSR